MTALYECPKCKELAPHKPRHYHDGTSLYIHEQKRLTKPFPHYLVVKSCLVKREEAAL